MKIQNIRTRLDEAQVVRHTVIDDTWTYEPHSQLGSNPGGIFTKGNNKYYVKCYKKVKQTQSEYAGTKIHALMGVKVLPIEMIEMQNKEFIEAHSGFGIKAGMLGIMSPWNPNLRVLGSRYYQISAPDAEHLGRSYIAAILCENWDIIGLVVDNQVRDSVTKELISVDHGGSFEFRAQGGDKQFNHGDINTHRTLRQYSPAKDVFSHVFSKFPDAETNAVRKLHSIRRSAVLNVFKEAGLVAANQLTDIVMSRVKALLEHYGHTYVPEEDEQTQTKKDGVNE